jgi:hypothetical protein
MFAPDNRPPDASDPDRQADLTDTLSMIMVQLTTIGNCLDLQGATLAHYALEHEYGLTSWAWFTEFINLRFGPPLRSNPLGELKELH